MAPPRLDQDVIDISDDDSSDGEAWGTPASTPRMIPINLDSDIDNDIDNDIGAELLVTLDSGVDSGVNLPSSEQGCLDKVLELFPDVSHAHVRQLYTDALLLTPSRLCQRVIEQLLESAGKYPKEERKPDRKRKRSDSIDPDELRKWEGADRVTDGHAYNEAAIKILSDEFVAIPVTHIKRIVREEKTIFRAFKVLENQQRELDSGMPPPFKRLATFRIKGRSSASASSEVTAELAAAKKKREQEERERREKAEKEEAERQNERTAMEEGSMTTCGCCFADTPINRMVPCDGDQAHLFCYACARQNVATEIGKGKCRPLCMDQSGCKAAFPRALLQDILEPKIFERLERMQQQEDITLAKLEGLESCPFCDYKAVMPPVHVDREFRCSNSECEKVTCRLCKEATHIPKTCEEAKKEKAIDKRHLVEEASTEAVIRVCNNCKNRFIKDVGCNKMTCPTCGHVQCYVCSKTIRNYDHYGPGRCPLYDNTDARHQDEVKRAEQAAMAKIRAENPDIAEDDLKVKVSERVQRAEAARVQQAQMRLPNAQPPPAPFAVVPPPHHLHHHPHAVPPAAAAIQHHAAFAPPLYQAFVMPGGHGMPVHLIHPVPAAAPAPPLHHHHHHLPQAAPAGAAAPAPIPAAGGAAPAPAAGAAAPAAPAVPAAHPFALAPPFAHHGHGHHNFAAPPLYAPMGGAGDAIGARVGAALGNLYAANARVQHELVVAERQLAEQRARVQRWQDDIARYELEARRRRRHL